MSHRPRVLIELGAELDRAARSPAARRLPTRPPGALSAALAIGIAVVVAAVAVIGLGHRQRPAPTVTPAGHAPSRSLEASFAALRRPRTAVDPIPTHYRLSPEPHPIAAGLRFADSRRVVSTAHEQLWLVPARHDLCTVEIDSGPRIPRNTGFGMGCITTAAAERVGLVQWSSHTLIAILPDGTGPVRLTFRRGGAITVVPDNDGVIEFHSRRVLRRYAFTTPEGTRFTNSLFRR
jgi:hypothetical protein